MCETGLQDLYPVIGDRTHYQLGMESGQGLVDGTQEFVERHGIRGDISPPTIPYPEIAVDEEECTVRVTEDLLVLRLGDDTIEIPADRLTLVGKMFIQG